MILAADFGGIAIMFQFADRVWHFLFRSRFEESLEHLSGRLNFTHRLLLIFAGALLVMGTLARHQLGALADTIVYGASSVSQVDRLELTSRERNKLSEEVSVVRPQLAAIARRFIGERRPAKNGFSWAVAQLVSAAPAESASFKAEYFTLLQTDIDSLCTCYVYDGIPHTIALAWILISYAELGVEAPTSLVASLLHSQDSGGWWSIAMDATPNDGNAGVPATAISVIALQRLSAKGMVPDAMRAEVSGAIQRGQTWLSGVVAGGWDKVADYPYNSRNNVDPAFATMAATALWGSSLRSGFAASAMPTVGPRTDTATTSDTFVVRTTGDTYIDRYRHVAYAWSNSGLIVAYPQVGFADRVRIREMVAQGLSQHITGKELLDQEWMLAEITFAQARFLEETADSNIPTH